MKTLRAFAVALPALLAPVAAQAQFMGGHFDEQGGAAIFHGVCQACHMPDAKGATGAGRYPALAGDSNLVVAAYPIAVVVNGNRNMPAFGRFMTDVQIADVINYVRTHFGNRYADAVTPAAVNAARPKPRPKAK